MFVTPPFPQDSDPIQQLSFLRGWNPDAVRAVGAVAWHGEVRFPMRDLHDHDAVKGWRRRRGDNEPFHVQGQFKKALTVAGGNNGVIGPFPLRPGGTLLIFEGEADLCAALTACPEAVALATPGATPGPRTLAMVGEAAADRDAVVLFCDPDGPGAIWSNTLRTSLLRRGVNVWAVPPLDGQDTDKRLAAGATLEDLIATALPAAQVWPWATPEMVERYKADTGKKPRPEHHQSWTQSHPRRAEFETYLEQGWPRGQTRLLFFRQGASEFWTYTLVKTGSEDAAKRLLAEVAVNGVDENRAKNRLETVALLKAPEGWEGHLPSHQRVLAMTTCGLEVEALLSALKQEMKLSLGPGRHVSRLINGTLRTARWVLEQDPQSGKPVIIGLSRMAACLGISRETVVSHNAKLRHDFPLFKLVPWSNDHFYDQARGLEMRVILNLEYALSLLVWAQCPEKRSLGTYKPQDAQRPGPSLAQALSPGLACPEGAGAPGPGQCTEESGCQLLEGGLVGLSTPGPVQLCGKVGLSEPPAAWDTSAFEEVEPYIHDSEPAAIDPLAEELDYMIWLCTRAPGFLVQRFDT